MAILSAQTTDGHLAPIGMVDSPSTALKILADRRFEAIWPELLAWAGSDLVALRDRTLARAKLGADAGFFTQTSTTDNEQWVGDNAVAGVLRYALVLYESARRTEAVALLRQREAALPKDVHSAASRIFLLNREAALLFYSGDRQGALDLLERAAQDPALNGEYKINIQVNQAMLQAQAAQYQSAFVIIDNAWKDFNGEQADQESVKVPASEANFAWIKACALNGLGQHDKASALMKQIRSGTNDGAEQDVEANARISGFLCMHDDAALADELAAQLGIAAPMANVFFTLQPGSSYLPEDRETIAAALRRPVMIKMLATRARLLGGDLGPAVRSWNGDSRH
jgi:tetratricopeptide (TPR) repeat protein